MVWLARASPAASERDTAGDGEERSRRVPRREEEETGGRPHPRRMPPSMMDKQQPAGAVEAAPAPTQMSPEQMLAQAPMFQSFDMNKPLTSEQKENMDKATNVANTILERLGLAVQGGGGAGGNIPSSNGQREFRRKPVSDQASLFGSDDLNAIVSEAQQNRVDLQELTSGHIPGLAPIPVPGFAGPQDVPTVPGVNTIPGLSNFNYIVGQLVPQMIPPTNTLLGSSISRLLPKETTKNLAKYVFRAVHPAAENVEVARMMGRWFQVINSPHVIREACTVSHCEEGEIGAWFE